MIDDWRHVRISPELQQYFNLRGHREVILRTFERNGGVIQFLPSRAAPGASLEGQGFLVRQTREQEKCHPFGVKEGELTAIIILSAFQALFNPEGMEGV